jgi:hypothetical protein
MLELGHTPRLYVHGNVESREIELVRRLAAACDLKAIVEPIDEQCLDPDWLSSRLPTAENVVFPHWHRAGEVLRGHGIETVAAGTYGEVLGGHYGPAMLKKGSGKAFTVARELLGLVPHKQGISGPEEEDLHRLVNLLRPPLTLRPYYYAEEWWKSQSDISSELQADALEVLMGYVSRGVKSSALLVEAFVTEHRGAQYIAAQPLSLMNDVTAVQPFADSGLLRLASRIPHERRVHNLLNRRMLRRAAPQLAEYPMAATLVPAKWPVAAQELSRLARSTTEKLESMVGDRINFRSPRAWSWVDFSFVKMPGAIEPLLADLRLPIWNRMTLQRTLNRVRGGGVSAHGFYDQLMKIATVDLLLRDN